MAKQDTDLTIEQYKIVLERIASCCVALESVLARAIDEDTSQEIASLIDAGKMLSTYIGGMADNAARPGGAIIGNHERWNYGPAFAIAGKGVQHGN